jgi:O-antigen/teichoic acid export membrane protein
MSKKDVINSILWLVFDKVFILIVNLFITIKIANYYGKETFGLYEYALSTITIISILLTFVDGRVIKKLFSLGNDSHILHNTNIAKLFLSILTITLALIVMFFNKNDSTFQIIYILLLFNVIIINLTFSIQSYFEYKLRIKGIVIASNISILLSAFFQLYAISLNVNIIYIAMIVMLSSLVKLLMIFIQFKIKFKMKIVSGLDVELIKSIIVESAPLAIAAAASIIYHKVDQVMIGNMIDIASVGVYSVSAKMINVVAIVIAPIQIAIFPKMIEWFKNSEKIYIKKFIEITNISIYIYIFGMIFTYFFGNIIFSMVFSNEYSESYSVFKLHVLGIFFSYLAILRSSHYTLNKSTYIMTISQIIALVMNVVLNYFFIPLYGIYGAAVATIVTQSMALLFIDVFFKEGRKVFILQLKSLSPFRIIKLLTNEITHLFKK